MVIANVQMISRLKSAKIVLSTTAGGWMPIDKKIVYNKKKRKRPLILVTNDDGIHSHGIRILAKHLRKLGDVYVVAPDQERSAASHSLTLHRPLRIEKISPYFYAVDGTPTDCINLGINAIMKEQPTLIVSGINRGPNLGDDVHYSGTVSAAVEGGIFEIPSIAMSLVTRTKFQFESAAHFGAKLAAKVLKKGLPKGVILNVNVPNLPKTRIKGFQYTILGNRNYSDIIVEKVDPRGRKYYWIGGDEVDSEELAGSDCTAVANGYVSVTPIRVNLTATGFLKELKKWGI